MKRIFSVAGFLLLTMTMVAHGMDAAEPESAPTDVAPPAPNLPVTFAVRFPAADGGSYTPNGDVCLTLGTVPNWPHLVSFDACNGSENQAWQYDTKMRQLQPISLPGYCLADQNSPASASGYPFNIFPLGGVDQHSQQGVGHRDNSLEVAQCNSDDSQRFVFMNVQNSRAFLMNSFGFLGSRRIVAVGHPSATSGIRGGAALTAVMQGESSILPDTHFSVGAFAPYFIID